MKNLLTLILAVSCALLAALPADLESSFRALSNENHSAGNIRLQTSNYGNCRELFYPSQNEDQLLYVSSLWVSAKLQRRDAEGRRLFWLAQNPSADSSGTTHEGAPDWNPGLKAVLDTLTSVGFDGDMDLYELLPAHNPLLAGNAEAADLYNQYNARDLVLKSILGYPAPREFAFPDPLGNYCFSDPQPGSFATPGFETLSAYFYDFCPFGTVGDRDLGSSHALNTHYPLGLAIHRESYAWNLQNHDKMVIFKYTLINTSERDTLFDLAIAEYVDGDVIPGGMGIQGASDDVSGYVKGPGYEFAYTRDADGDGGLSPNWLAHKIVLPELAARRHCWYWRVGDGPGDSNPLSFNFAPRRTANEKHWLMTGRNPNPTKFQPLRPEEEGMWEYEQPQPNDTRFLHTLYSSQPTEADPDPENRLHMTPGASFSFYSVLFVGDGIDDLKARSLAIENFLAGGLQIDPSADLTCIPYLSGFAALDGQVAKVDWHSYTDPARFEVIYKPFDAPAAEWRTQALPGSARSFHLWDLDPQIWYQVKVAAVYNPGPSEVYLESETLLASLDHPPEPSYQIPPFQLGLTAFPNPFRGRVLLSFTLKDPGQTSLKIYNLRGQMVRELIDEDLAAGQQARIWDGRDSNANPCAAGIYLLKLHSGSRSLTRKLILLN
ncbi:MAG: T9SS type A sorting domain-containing protein [Candidatus Syntrophosphaera sp.]|nr:T9SS type A sorting domain-containing protein [Candidatus Syntrophosphaera sp.]